MFFANQKGCFSPTLNKDRSGQQVQNSLKPILFLLIGLMVTPAQADKSIQPSLNCPPLGWTEGLARYLKADAKMPTDDTASLPTPDCNFHEWSWEAYVWATSLINGTPRFMTMHTPDDLFKKESNKKTKLLRLSSRLTSAHASGSSEGAGAIVQADGNMMVTQNGYPVYGSIHMNDSYFNTVKNNLIKNGGYQKNTGNYFKVGAAVFKATWLRLDKNEQPPAGAFTTLAEVPYLKVDKNTMSVFPSGQFTKVKVALVGLHVVGYTENHPEFLWASFEHKNNVPIFDDNTYPQCSKNGSSRSYTFYRAGTPWRDISENFAKGDQGPGSPVNLCGEKLTPAATLSFNQITQKFSPPTNAVQENRTGGENQTNGPQNIASLNNSSQGFLHDLHTPQSTFANYYLLGTVWMAPNIYVRHKNPSWDSLAAPNGIGSVNLANSTAETFFQVPKNTVKPGDWANCFACHNPKSFHYPDSCGGSRLLPRRIALSHVVAEGTPCAVPNTIKLRCWQDTGQAGCRSFTIKMTLSGVLQAGKWRTADELNHMSAEDKRNTLIVELSKHTNQPGGYFQGFDNDALIGKGAIVVFLQEAGIRDDNALKNMSDDDERNTLIVEDNNHTDKPIPQLQGMNNQELVQIGLEWFANAGK